MMMVMTNRPELRPLLLLLTLSSLVISNPLPNNGESTSQNTTTSSSVQDTKNTPASGLGLTTAQHTLEMATGQRNETHGDDFLHGGTERNTTHQDAGTESPAGTESSSSTAINSSSSGPTSLPGSSTITSVASHLQPGDVTSKQATSSAVASEATTTRATAWTTMFNITEKTIPTTMKPTPSTQTQNQTTTTITTTTTTTVHICPTEAPRGESLVGRCLFAIALLTALATIFIMTTIILATKLAGIRYRHKAIRLQETEMVCISALMNDTEHPVPMPRRPKSNGALIPNTEEEDGDDLTLNSFLPDNESMAQI